jgi:hypothetical protein
MPSVDEVAGRITATGVPALFLDTCILLDIIRSTHRCLPDYAAQASELLKLASADYCEIGGRLHPALDSEFIACDLTFTTNLPWAVHEITH